MSVNKYLPHVLVIPEDDANRQLALCFLDHEAVEARVVGLEKPAGGWAKVLELFEAVYLPMLNNSRNAHVIMLIDFDQQEDRRPRFDAKIPDDLRDRVFVIGSQDTPESLRSALSMTWEKIGAELAQDCFNNEFKLWAHPHLSHNAKELERLVEVVRPILFPNLDSR